MHAIELSKIQALLSNFEGVIYEPRGSQLSSALSVRGEANIGAGDDFHSFRPYRDGDDVRLVDWSAFARSRELWTRQFTEHRTKRLVLALDGSRSMSGEKWVRGVTLSLVMAALCHQGGHEVAFFVFTANGLVEVPHRFETNVDPVALDWLSQFNCIGQSSLKPLQESVDRFGGAEVVVLSDFMWADVYTELEALRTSSLSPFSLIRFSSAQDVRISEGMYMDPETMVHVEMSAGQASQVQESLVNFRAKLVELSRLDGVPLFDWTEVEDVQNIARWLSTRQGVLVADGCP